MEQRMTNSILIVGGYGEVGRRMAVQLEVAHPQQVVVAGRNPDTATGMRTKRIDVDDPTSIEAALDDVVVVVACVRQREPHLLHAAVRRGLAYTSLATPWLPWPTLEPLHAEARATGARIVLASGLEPGISSVLARIGAERVGEVDAVETALLMSVGDAYGADSMAFLLDEITTPYTVTVNGQTKEAHTFEQHELVTFPDPIGSRRAYSMSFRDQLYYPATLGAKTAIARLALDPPWLGAALEKLTKLGARSWLGHAGSGETMHGLMERLRTRYKKLDQFALVVEVRGRDRVVRSSLIGHVQADAAAAGAGAVVEALYRGEIVEPGVWLAEQVVAPEPFFARLAGHGLLPVIEEASRDEPSTSSGPVEQRTPQGA
jgi:saccharopine dehydrogenase-like NADP-dependent oxidoreductase